MNVMDMGIDELRIAVQTLRPYVAETKRLTEELQKLQAIVDELPKDADGDPIESGKPYYFPCANGAIRFFASLEPVTEELRAYPWGEAWKTREAARAARKEAADAARGGT